jgi:hypothetical protein
MGVPICPSCVHEEQGQHEIYRRQASSNIPPERKQGAIQNLKAESAYSNLVAAHGLLKYLTVWKSSSIAQSVDLKIASTASLLPAST